MAMAGKKLDGVVGNKRGAEEMDIQADNHDQNKDNQSGPGDQFVSGVEDKRGENLALTLNSVFKKELELTETQMNDIRISKYYRMGQFHDKQKSPRPIFVQVSDPIHKEAIMKAVYRLKDEHGAGRTLLRTLRENNVQNAMALASRWYACKIGSKRFAHYGNVGLSAVNRLVN